MSAADTPELEALFDQVAAQRVASQRVEAAVAPVNVPAVELPKGDEALARLQVGTQPAVTDPGEMVARIGSLTRQLRDALSAVGADDVLDRAAREIPESRDRLSFIARLTEQAAERALTAVEIGQSRQNELQASSAVMSRRWEKFFAGGVDAAGFKALVQDTRLFAQSAESTAQATNAQLLEIMMAQDFQDLTGQVIQKLMRVVNDFETQLVQFLIDAAPADKRAVLAGDDLEGPIVAGAVRKDVVANQQQVDDLLESLGF